MDTGKADPTAGTEDVTDEELLELLNAPEPPELKALLDSMVSDPEEILKRARARLALREKKS